MLKTRIITAAILIALLLLVIFRLSPFATTVVVTLLVLAGASKVDSNDSDLRIAASRAKLFATEMAGRVADQAMQILGGSGYMADLPIERMYRDLRGYRIGEGASEIQRIQIARNVLAGR